MENKHVTCPKCNWGTRAGPPFYTAMCAVCGFGGHFHLDHRKNREERETKEGRPAPGPNHALANMVGLAVGAGIWYQNGNVVLAVSVGLVVALLGRTSVGRWLINAVVVVTILVVLFVMFA